jgi:ribosomal protein L32
LIGTAIADNQEDSNSNPAIDWRKTMKKVAKKQKKTRDSKKKLTVKTSIKAGNTGELQDWWRACRDGQYDRRDLS